MSLAEKLKQIKAAAAAASGGGDDKKIYNLGDGTHTIKFRMPAGRVWDPANDQYDDFFQEYVVDYKDVKNSKYEYNGPKTYFAVPAVILESTVKGLADKTKIVYIRLNGIQLTQVAEKLEKVKNLLDPNGYFVTLKISSGPYKSEMNIFPDDTIDTSEATYPAATIEEAAAWASSNKTETKANEGDPPAGLAYA